MARHSPLHAHSPSRVWATRIGFVLLAAVAAYLLYEFGRIQAGYNVVDASRARQAYENEIAVLESEIVSLKEQIALLETHRNIDREAYSDVETSLAELQVELRSVARVLLSHLHADHIGGLEELGFTGYFAWAQRPVLYLPENLRPLLWEHSLCGGMGQRLRRADGGFFEATCDTYFDVRPLAAGRPVELGSVVATPFPTPHSPGRPSWGFRLQVTLLYPR